MKYSRHAMLNELTHGPLTGDELAEIFADDDRKKITDNMGKAANEQLVKRSKDDSGILYTITSKGHERLKEMNSKPGSIVDDDTPPPADPELLAKANRMLAERLEEIYAAFDVQTHDEALATIQLFHEVQRQNLQLLTERQEQNGNIPMGQKSIGYTVINMDGALDVFKTVEEAKESAISILAADKEYIGGRIAIMQIMGTVENVVVQQWSDAA